MAKKKSIAIDPIVEKMFSNDHFSKWLKIERLHEEPGKVTLQLVIRKEMLNGFGIAHGAITYALADSALAFASNAHGVLSFSIETSISHLKKLSEGDSITATTEEISISTKIAIYHIHIKKNNKELVATFKGIVYRSSDKWNM
jgi:acyl-CoA thioesterase